MYSESSKSRNRNQGDGGIITVNFPFFWDETIQCKSMVILRDFPFEFVIMTCAEKQVFLCFPFQWGINGCCMLFKSRGAFESCGGLGDLERIIGLEAQI